MPADAMLPPSKRFQSGGGEERFQIFAGDSSSTPTWKSSRGLAGGWTDFTKARITGEMVSPSGCRTRRPTEDPRGYSCRDGYRHPCRLKLTVDVFSWNDKQVLDWPRPTSGT